MSIQPEGEDLRKAVRWISEEKKYNPSRTYRELIDEACLKFDLSPMEANYLEGFIRKDR